MANLAQRRMRALADRRRRDSFTRLTTTTLEEISNEGWDDYCAGDAPSTEYKGAELDAYETGWHRAKAAQGDEL